MAVIIGGVQPHSPPLSIRGKLLREGEPLAGIVAIVRLSDGRLFRKRAGKDGEYSFPVYNAAARYTVVGFDHGREFNAVVADRVAAVPHEE